MNKKTILFYLSFAILMIGLGCSDALRGVFAPVFQNHFALNTAKLSMIITVSYIGNLVFMLIGSNLSDRFGIRRVFICAVCCLIGALAVYAASDSYYALLFGVFFAMGTSTLLNMLINIMSPILFSSPGATVNTLFFIQSIGTFFAQSVISSNVSTFGHWKLVNLALIAIGAVSIVIFTLLSGSEAGLKKQGKKEGSDKKEKIGYADLMKNPVFWLFVLVFGFYFVGEHGVMNWMNIYCQDYLSMSAAKAAMMPSMFFGGMMVGRLVLAPLVSKLGIRQSLLVCLGGGTVLYVAAFLFGGNAMYLLLVSGLLISITYPTLTMCIQLFFDESITTTASGTILAIATVFDIAFNAVFGSIIDLAGYGIAMKILPAAMAVSILLYAFMIRRFKPIREI